MGGGGLLIFYVTNVCYVTKVKSAFSYILYRILVHFVPDFPAQKPYLCTEFQSALKPPKTNTRNCEPPYLPAAQPKHKGRV